MKTVNMPKPELRDVMDSHAAMEFPPGFMLPLTHLIRTAYRHEANKREPVRFIFPEYGVLEMHGRQYKFEPTDKYRAEKAGKELIDYEGTW